MRRSEWLMISARVAVRTLLAVAPIGAAEPGAEVVAGVPAAVADVRVAVAVRVPRGVAAVGVARVAPAVRAASTVVRVVATGRGAVPLAVLPLAAASAARDSVILAAADTSAAAFD